jgi:hypothetical protein
MARGIPTSYFFLPEFLFLDKLPEFLTPAPCGSEICPARASPIGPAQVSICFFFFFFFFIFFIVLLHFFFS